MDWAAIIIAVVGGAAGALAGSILALPFARGRGSEGITAVFIVIGAIVGARTAPFWLEPIAGDSIREITGEADSVGQLLEEMEEEPVFATIFSDYPGARADVERRLREAYENGGRRALEREFIAIAEEYSGAVIRNYLPRARNEDVIAFGRAYLAVVGTLRERAPLVCYAWLFDSATLDLAEFNRRAGGANQDRLGAAVRAVIVNAGPEAVAYDRDAAERTLGEIGETVLTRYPAETREIMLGSRPVMTDDHKIMMCGLVHDLYTEILAHARASDILRYVMTGGGGLTAEAPADIPALGFMGHLLHPADPFFPLRGGVPPR